MACEEKRGCGYRKVGGLYLVGSGQGIACDRLPIALDICPCCGAGFKQTRGWTWVDVGKLVDGPHMLPPAPFAPGDTLEHDTQLTPCECHSACPLCKNPSSIGKAGMLWIGTQFYPTIDHFENEARTQGISRRINTIPHGFKLGETWMLFAHLRGILKPTGDLKAKYVPAIFRVWRPTRIERIFVESDRNGDKVAADVKRGITPVFVPDNDPDHKDGGTTKTVKPAAASVTPPLFG